MIRESAPALRKQPGAWQRKWSPMQPDCTTPPLKACTKCGREHPATLEYFHARPGSRLHSWCKACMAAYHAAYNAAHRDERAAYKAAYYADRREEIAADNAAYRAAHREEAAAYRAEHRDERAAYCVAYRAEHREELAAYYAAYNADHRDERAALWAAYYASHREEIAADRADHPERSAAATRNRKARKLGNGGTHTAADIRAQYARQKGRCIYCHEKVGDTYHVDHVMPVILGGSNGPENLVIACPTCNLSKGAKHPQDFCGRLL